MLTRRQALKLMGQASAATVLGPMRRALGAAAPSPDARLVVILLRGGLDGLAAVPPHGDPEFALRRPQRLASADEAAPAPIDLDGMFGLHPDLSPLKAWFDAGELLIAHAIGLTPRRPAHVSAHLAAQRLLASGRDTADIRDGWLNRALGGLGADAELGLAAGRATPLIFRGPAAVRLYTPPRLPKVQADMLQRLDALYANDPLLQPTFARVRAAINAEQGRRWRWDPSVRRPTFRVFCDAMGESLAQPNGPRLAALDAHGWDTHAQQSAQLPALFAELVDGLQGLRTSLEPVWRHTVVLVVTEFGRAVDLNRDAGTEHGAASVAFALGGAVAGGRVVGSWPGLNRSGLAESRDLQVTTDLRALFKAALRDHLGLAASFIDDRVFPGSRAIDPLPNFMRAS